MLEPALSALTYLHSSGFVHGRLKPSNFMASDGRLKISSDSVSQIGTGSLTPADDVWGLGMTLVEALTQRRPVWNAGDTRDPVLPETIPPEFREIARNALRRDPRSRWTVAQIRERLSGRAAGAGKRLSPSMISTALLAGALAIVAGTLVIRNREIAPSGASQSQPVQSQPAPVAPQPAPAAAPPTPVIPPPQVESKPSPVGPGHQEIVHREIVQQVMPEVLPRARNSIRGRVTASVRVEVDSSGDVTNATLESEGSSQYFSNAALSAARRWKFASADGPRVWILKFEFTRTGTKVAPAKSG
jgi:TonB family protein